jgi:hypothetical protein
MGKYGQVAVPDDVNKGCAAGELADSASTGPECPRCDIHVVYPTPQRLRNLPFYN